MMDDMKLMKAHGRNSDISKTVAIEPRMNKSHAKDIASVTESVIKDQSAMIVDTTVSIPD